MDVTTTDKRKFKRFARRSRLEVRDFSRRGKIYHGVLVDCSHSGAGLFMPHAIRTHTVIVLRICQDAHQNGDSWGGSGGVFYMISAVVRWCREGVSIDGLPGFRIGVERLLPAV